MNLDYLRRFVVPELGWALAPMLAISCVAGVVLVLALALRRSHVKALYWATAASACSLVLVGVRVAQSRAEVAALWLQPALDYSERTRGVTEAGSHLWTTMHLGTVVPTGVLACVLLTLLLRGRRNLAASVVAVAALLAAVTAAAACASNWQLMVNDLGCEASCFFRAVTRAQHWSFLGKVVVAGCAGLSWVALALGARSDALRALSVSRRALVTSTLLLLAGAAAFVGTRAVHWDAEHLFPPDADDAQMCAISPPQIEQLPPAGPGCAGTAGPRVDFTPQGAVLDGNIAATPEELQALLKGKRELWQLINPGRNFVGVVVFAAPRMATTQQLLPWLAAVPQAGYASLAPLLRKPTLRMPTKTLGLQIRVRCCATHLRVDDSATSALTSWATWGDVTAAVSGAPGSVALR